VVSGSRGGIAAATVSDWLRPYTNNRQYAATAVAVNTNGKATKATTTQTGGGHWTARKVRANLRVVSNV